MKVANLSLCLSHLVSLPLSFGKGIEDFLFFFSPGIINIILPREVGGNRGYNYRA